MKPDPNVKKPELRRLVDYWTDLAARLSGRLDEARSIVADLQAKIHDLDSRILAGKASQKLEEENECLSDENERLAADNARLRFDLDRVRFDLDREGRRYRFVRGTAERHAGELAIARAKLDDFSRRLAETGVRNVGLRRENLRSRALLDEFAGTIRAHFEGTGMSAAPLDGRHQTVAVGAQDEDATDE